MTCENIWRVLSEIERSKKIINVLGNLIYQKEAQIRRLLSVSAIKAQVGCLLGRLHQVGPGNKQLAKKREWAVRQDEKMRRERHSQ